MAQLFQNSFGVRGIQRIATLPVNASTTFKAGDFLSVNSNGELIVACAAGSSVGAVSGITGRIAGRATMDSTDEGGTQRKRASFIVAEAGTEFEMPLYSATPASAVPTPASQLRVAFELIRVNNTVPGFAVNLDATTNVKLAITDFNIDDFPTWPDSYVAGSTQYARAWVAFDPTKCLLNAG